MGIQALVSHAKGPKHIKNIELKKGQPDIAFFSQNITKPETTTSTTVSIELPQSTKSGDNQPKTEEPRNIQHDEYNDDDVTSRRTWPCKLYSIKCH